MFKVTIQNSEMISSSNGQYGLWIGEFNTLEEANIWIDEAKLKKGKTPDVASYIGPIDMMLNENYVKEVTREKRRKEYPSELELLEAIMESFEGNEEKLQIAIAKRRAIKLKYPISQEVK